VKKFSGCLLCVLVLMTMAWAWDYDKEVAKYLKSHPDVTQRIMTALDEKRLVITTEANGVKIPGMDREAAMIVGKYVSRRDKKNSPFAPMVSLAVSSPWIYCETAEAEIQDENGKPITLVEFFIWSTPKSGPPIRQVWLSLTFEDGVLAHWDKGLREPLVSRIK